MASRLIDVVVDVTQHLAYLGRRALAFRRKNKRCRVCGKRLFVWNDKFCSRHGDTEVLRVVKPRKKPPKPLWY